MSCKVYANGKLGLPEDAKRSIFENLTNEDCAEGTRINWAADVIWDFGCKMPFQMTALTAAFMHCYINGTLAGVDLSRLKVSEEDARLAIGASCYEAVEKTLDRLCGGKTDE